MKYLKAISLLLIGLILMKITNSTIHDLLLVNSPPGISLWRALVPVGISMIPLIFFTYRAFVFNVRKNNLRNYLRFNLVYLFTYLINLVLLVILTKKMYLNIYLAQGLIIVSIAIIGFFLNKNYSFSNKKLLNKK